jgi:hypothetical protein
MSCNIIINRFDVVGFFKDGGRGKAVEFLADLGIESFFAGLLLRALVCCLSLFYVKQDMMIWLFQWYIMLKTLFEFLNQIQTSADYEIH